MANFTDQSIEAPYRHGIVPIYYYDYSMWHPNTLASQTTVFMAAAAAFTSSTFKPTTHSLMSHIWCAGTVPLVRVCNKPFFVSSAEWGPKPSACKALHETKLGIVPKAYYICNFQLFIS